MRDSPGEISLDRAGFQIAGLKTALAYEDFTQDERIESVYYAEVDALLRRELNAERVVRRRPHRSR